MDTGATFEGDADKLSVDLTVNAEEVHATVEPRMLLLDLLRDEFDLGGTHAGCEHGGCGACTILLDGEAVRSCLLLAAQAKHHEITTIEGVTDDVDGTLHPVQQAFWDCHALQCGFCTPGMVLAAIALLEQNPHPTDDEIRTALAGNVCRCTGYVNIVEAVRTAAERMRRD